MFERFLNGLIFGAGAAVAILVVAAPVYLIVNFPVFKNKIIYSRGGEEISAAPEINDTGRFLGSSNTYSERFSHDKSRVLAGGSGEIIGTAFVNGQPVSGLKLRLALNGSVMSQWATTDSNGQYAIAVPYGEYRIDGFELDKETANSTLGGKINHPLNANSTERFEVSEDAPGRGIDFRFVDPVVLDMRKKSFRVDEEIVVRWKPYPGATGYSVQIYEKPDPHRYMGHEPLFSWPALPEVEEPFLNLEDYDVQIKPGHYYVVSIDAKTGEWRTISRTPWRFSGFDFEVTE